MKNYPIYDVALSLIEGIGGVLARQLISYCGSAEEVFRTPKSKLIKIPQIGNHIANLIEEKSSLLKAEYQIETAAKYDIDILHLQSDNYPKKLKDLYDAPIILYYKGNANLNTEKSVAIVGTRNASDYGKQVTEELVKQLKKHNTLIVSGLAYGIDITAHRSSLQNNLDTVGILANGLDTIYPAVHKNTAQKMIEQGGLLSENSFGTKPDAMRFPARNRIIAGMSDAIIVVEAKAKGGAMITANIANSYNKDVFAIPGDIHSKTSEGCNNLIKSHRANLMTSIEDLEYIMNWNTNKKTQNKQKKLNFDQSNLNEIEKLIIQLLGDAEKKELFLDEITWKLEKNPSEISSALLNLELLSILKVLPGKKVVLN